MEAHFANNISWILIEILWQIHDLPKYNISKYNNISFIAGVGLCCLYC